MAHPAQSETGYWPFIWLTVLCRLFTFYFVLLFFCCCYWQSVNFSLSSRSLSVSRLLLLRLGGIVFSAQKDLAEFALSGCSLSLSVSLFRSLLVRPAHAQQIDFHFWRRLSKIQKKNNNTHKLVQRRNFHLCHFFVVACFVFVVATVLLSSLLLLLVVNRFALAIRILRLGLQKQIPVSSSAGSGQWDNNNNCLFLLPLLQKRCCRTQTHTRRTHTHTHSHTRRATKILVLPLRLPLLCFAFALSSSLLLLLLLLQRRTGFCFCTSLCIWLSLFRATTIKSNRERIDNWKLKRFYWI